ARGSRTRTRAEVALHCLVLEIRDEGVAKGVRIARLDQDPGVANDLLDGAGAIADDRRPGGEGLERRQAEALEQRGMEEALRARVERRQRRIVHAAGHDDPLARRAGLLQRAREERGELPEIAGDNEAKVRVCRGGAAERREETLHVLPRVELTDIQNVP